MASVPQRFLSLTEFCKHLGRTGVCHVDETEKGWWIQWIDNSPRALAKAEANQKKERGDMDDEMRQRKLIQEQIERAREEGERRRREVAAQQAGGGPVAADEASEVAPSASTEVSNELKRDEGEKLSLSLSFKAPVAAGTTMSAASKDASPSGSASPPTEAGPSATQTASPPDAPATTATPAPAAPPKSTFIAPPPKPVIGFTPKANPFAAKPNPLKSNPLNKKPNPLRSGGGGLSSSSNASEKRKAPMSAVEQIAMEEMARKQRRMG